MFRFALEILVVLLVGMVARAVLSSVMKGIGSAARNASSQDSPRRGEANDTRTAGVLHKDPVCGTYVAATTPFQRQAATGTYFYCSEACQTAHVKASR